MVWHGHIYAIPLLLSSVVALLMSLLVWRRRQTPGAIGLLLTLLAVGVWAASEGIMLGFHNEVAILFWRSTAFVALMVAVTAWLLFTLQYTRSDFALNLTLIILLAIMPFLATILAYTNAWHGMFWTDIVLIPGEDIQNFTAGLGLFARIDIVYANLLMVVSGGLLVGSILKSTKQFRERMIWLVVAIVPPWIISLLVLFDLSPIPLASLVPIIFTGSGVVVTLSLIRFNLLDQLPVAYDLVFENLSDSIFLIDRENRVVDLNLAAQNFIAMKREDVLGVSIGEVFPEVGQRLKPNWQSTTAYTEVQRQEGAKIRYYNMRITPLETKAKRPQQTNSLGHIIMLRDSTREKEIQVSLFDSEARYRRIIEGATDVVYTVDRQGVITFVSPSIRGLAGYSPEELIGESFLILTPADRYQWMESFFSGQLEERVKPVQLEFPVITKTGEQIWVAQNADLIREDGKVVGLQAIVRDITRSRLSEAELERRNTLLEVLTFIIRDAMLFPEIGPLLETITSFAGHLIDVTSAFYADLNLVQGTTTILAEYIGPEADPRELESVRGTTYRIAEMLGTQLDYLLADTDHSIVRHVDDDNLLEKDRYQLLMRGGKSSLLLPMVVGEDTIGYVVFWESRVKREFSELDIRTVQAIIQQVAAVIENTTLHQSLRESERRYRDILENASDLIQSFDADLNYIYVNRRWREVMGYDEDDITMLKLRNLVHPEKHEAMDTLFKQLQNGGSVDNVELTFMTKQGRLVDLEGNINAEVDEGTGKKVFRGIFRDITERKKAEESLYRERRNLHLIISSMPNVLMMLDAEDAMISFFVPPHFPQVIDFKRGVKVGDSVKDILPASMVGDMLVALDYVSAKKADYTFEQHVEVGGQDVYLNVRVMPIAGSPEKLLVLDNITERKNAELAESEQRILAEALRDTAESINSSLELDEVLDNILDNIELVIQSDLTQIMLIGDGKIRVVRRRWSREEFSKSKMDRILDISELPLIERATQNKKPILVGDTSLEPLWNVFKGAEWIASYAGIPVMEDEKVIGFINLNSAILNAYSPAHVKGLKAFANHMAVAMQNAQLYAELQQRNRELDAFSQTVAHDLKNPLGVIQGYSELLETTGKEMSERSKGYLGQINELSSGMTDMVNNLLLFARLDSAEKIVGRMQPRDAIKGAMRRLDNKIADRGIAVEIEKGKMPDVMAYSPWVEEVFANLIGNAVKYIGSEEQNESPRIIVRSEAIGSTMVRFKVEDNGLGIEEKHHGLLFESFTRFHYDVAEGSGLGLSIVDRIISKMNGEVGVESEVGKGSIFWFTLPAG